MSGNFIHASLVIGASLGALWGSYFFGLFSFVEELPATIQEKYEYMGYWWFRHGRIVGFFVLGCTMLAWMGLTTVVGNLTYNGLLAVTAGTCYAAVLLFGSYMVSRLVQP